ncbi:class I SAM-dependent methyltransferase [Phragmitibacter flavus]|uniref:Class I SAM-dependent methyltransferase n=1 Tax=Phragmitibacter flavus TaxID=2576071 RepID=A0A5R8K918_9BACT|nr:class I SAM-dependent methyltransferase [Phragmitibacter flavus]TLD68435.1 class I SAM-dependent methyltransferase [Phragmitibacter flavus]
MNAQTELKKSIRKWVPAPLMKAYHGFALRKPKDTPARRQRLRAEALQGTKFPLSRDLLEKLPTLVAHGYPSGNPDLHYQDTDVKTGIACTEAEACLLHHAARLAQPRAAMEIGSYIGWSTVHIAAGLPASSTLTCVDPFLKGGGLHETKDLDAEARFLANIKAGGAQEKVRLAAEKSPQVLDSIAPEGGWDWAFVDGWHMDGQPLKDLIGVLPLITPDAVIFLHDCWGADVRDALSFLLASGWDAHVFDTSNYLTICWKIRPAWMDEYISLGSQPEYVNGVAQARKIFHGLADASLQAIKEAYVQPVAEFVR